MPARSGAVHVATTRRVYKGKTYVTHLLRRSIRKGKTVTHETLGNLSHLPDHLIEIIKRSLKGETFVPAAETFRITRSLPHGHVDAVLTMIRKLGVEELIASKRTRQRDLVIAMIAERLIFPNSKLAHTRHWHDTTLAEKLDIADATEDHLYDAMDWLLLRQKAIEKKLARRHLGEGAMVLYDVTSSYYEGKTCPLARFGYDRDGKTGCPIIVYGMLTDADGRPVAVQVYPGNTGDPKTVPDQVEALTKRFGLAHVVLVGDRGMLTQTQIDVLKKHPGLGWISALRSGAIRRLLADGHLVRKDLVSVRLAEITSPDFPGERLVACYNQPFQHATSCIIMGAGNGLRLSTSPRQGCINHYVRARVLAPTPMPTPTLAAPRVSTDSRHSSLSDASNGFRWRFSRIVRRCPSASWSVASWNRCSMRRLWKSFSRNMLPSNILSSWPSTLSSACSSRFPLATGRLCSLPTLPTRLRYHQRSPPVTRHSTPSSDAWIPNSAKPSSGSAPRS